jgi:hypothetical protein
VRSEFDELSANTGPHSDLASFSLDFELSIRSKVSVELFDWKLVCPALHTIRGKVDGKRTC